MIAYLSDYIMENYFLKVHIEEAIIKFILLFIFATSKVHALGNMQNIENKSKKTTLHNIK